MNNSISIPMILAFQSATMVLSLFIGFDYLFNRKLLVVQSNLFLLLAAVLFLVVFVSQFIKRAKGHGEYFQKLIDSRDKIYANTNRSKLIGSVAVMVVFQHVILVGSILSFSLGYYPATLVSVLIGMSVYYLSVEMRVLDLK